MNDSNPAKPPILKRLLLLLLALAAALVANQLGLLPEGGSGAGGGEVRSGGAVAVEVDEGAQAVAEAFRRKQSGLMVEVGGTVEKVLPDDDEGSRHQRFIVALADGATVLIAHNIDLAPRVPLDEGDAVRFRGQYEWNDRGGVVHWTHHDPDGRHPGGWIEHGGRRFE